MRCAIVDVSDPEMPGHLTPRSLALLTGGVYLVSARKATLGAAVAAGIKALAPDDDAVWILHDDCAPAPDCLEHLLAAFQADDGLAIVGPKQCLWEDDARLLEVGIVASARGKRLDTIEPGEVDQGQYDRRGEVLAVGTAGMLLDLEAWRHLGGFDPNLGPFGDGWELGRRARLAGYRVRVCPAARVRHARAGLLGARPAVASVPARAARLATLARRDAPPQSGPDVDEDAPRDHVDLKRRSVRLRPGDPTEAFLEAGSLTRSLGERRFAELYAWGLSTPALALPIVLVAALVWGGARTLRRIAQKAVRLALVELAAPWRFLFHLDRVIAQRRRIRRVAVRSRRSLRPYQASLLDVHAHRRLTRKIRRDAARPTPLEPVAARACALYRRRSHRMALVIVLAATALTAWVWADLWSGFTGGRFATLPDTWSGLRESAFSAWVAGGDGMPGPARPLLIPLTILSAPWALVGVSPATWWEVGVLLVPPLAACTAWVGAGAWVRSLPLRALSAAAWATWPTLWGNLAVGDGAGALVHVLLPLAAWGILALAQCAAPERYTGANGEVVRERRRAELSGAGVAALVLAVIAAAHPATGLLLALLTLAWGGTAAYVSRRGRLAVRAGLALVPALLLLAPSLLTAARAGTLWRVVWASPTGDAAPAPVTRLALVLGLPADPAAWVEHAPWWVAAVGAWPLLAALLAVGALTLPRRTWATRAALAVALMGAASLFIAPAGADVGGVLSVAGGALLVGAAGWEGARLPGRTSWHAVATLAAVGALVGSGLAWTHVSRDPAATVLEASPRATRVPAAATLPLSGPAKARLLVLQTTDNGIRADLRRHGDAALTDRTEFAAHPLDDAAGDLANALARLMRPGEPRVLDAFATHAIDQICVPHVEQNADLVAALDAVKGLTRLGEDTDRATWRLTQEALTPPGPPARATIIGEGERVRVDAGEVSVHAPLPAASDARTLVLAERADPAWHARLGGTHLAPTRSGWAQAFTIPAGVSGRLRVTYGPAWWPWWQGGVLLAVGGAALAAWPSRRREPR